MTSLAAYHSPRTQLTQSSKSTLRTEKGSQALRSPELLHRPYTPKLHSNLAPESTRKSLTKVVQLRRVDHAVYSHIPVGLI